MLSLITVTDRTKLELKADIVHTSSLQNETGSNSKNHTKIRYLSALFMAQTFVKDWGSLIAVMVVD